MHRIPLERLLIAVFAIATTCPDVRAEPAPEQELYWWQDEIRTVAFALSQVRTGHISQWPRISVPAGSATLPIPPASSPVLADGKLDEDAWQHATQLPIGPVFDAWQQGPFLLNILACRDEQHIYLAIRSPRDLRGLGALAADRHLFTIGDQALGVDRSGGWLGSVPAGSGPAVVGADGRIIELALPSAPELRLSCAIETLRTIDGRTAPALAALGLDHLAATGDARAHYRAPWLWLEPFTVRLVPAEIAVRLSCEMSGAGQLRLLSTTLEPGKTPVTAEQPLAGGADGAVYRYEWKRDAGGRPWSAEGCFYVEPVPQTAAAARDPSQNPDPRTPTARRTLYCRAREARAQIHRRLLDAPLLFVKQHPYFAAHIYDDFYPWHPGGGVYVLENPADDPASHRVRAVIDPATNETLGPGVYRDPDLSWDARQVVFACKPAADAVTSLYTIGVDGRGLKRLTASDTFHDITPAWLADDRIAFISTRPRALVPCFNSGVGTLHTMHADGSGIRSISANNVTEFDPAALPDGRLLYGRWEYVDKTALYMQSLWTMEPDGRMEEALFANNLSRPTALLDARPVPGSHQVIASLTPHNGQAVGAIGLVDTARGKNDLAAVFNFTPEYPVEMDQGLAVGPCDPFPLSQDDVLISNNAIGAHGIIELVCRDGSRELVICDPEVSCYAPMLVKPRSRPARVSPRDETAEAGRFLLVDVYQGLTGVERGTIKRLRVVEETARTSGIPPGGRWWNQAFLVSWQGAYIVKNILGTVPVHEDGSAYFEAPAGRALYFEALDADGREIQRMRTFVQAVPGTTRSCIGCHERKKHSPPSPAHQPLALREPPARPEAESWGSGYLDYPTMVQPVLDKYCVRCHGGPEGMGKGLDFSGGWTWAFNIGYETLIKHRLTGYLNCNNGSVHTSQILPPRTIGSGASPLAEILIKKHPEVSRAERDLVLAWMDTNSNYYGTWDYTPHATCDAILAVRGPLSAAMQEAGCVRCHTPGFIGHDWVNLQTPEWSRILRAPMAPVKGSLGLGMCRDRKARTGYPLVDQSVQPPDVFLPSRQPEWDPSGEPVVSIASAGDPPYQAMLDIIRHARAEALARPRIDMPGAEVMPGECRMQVPQPVPAAAPSLTASLRSDGAVELAWPRTAETIGLQYELHRGPTANFAAVPATQIGLTAAGRLIDLLPPVGRQHYALVVTSGEQRSRPVWASVDVPQPAPPQPPGKLTAQALPGEIRLLWEGPAQAGLRYNVYRAAASSEFALLNKSPLPSLSYSDLDVQPGVTYGYQVRAIDRRDQASLPSPTAETSPLPETQEPVFAAPFGENADAVLLDGKTAKGKLHGDARVVEGALTLGVSGFASFDHQPEFDLTHALSVECWVRIDQDSAMPVVLSCGAFHGQGWFVQRYGSAWRWHVAPFSCDGGRGAVGRWTHLVGTYSGTTATLYQDGQQVASIDCYPNRAPWPGPLVIGQYSSAGDSYQVHGRIAGVKIYRRVLRTPEVATHFRNGPPVQSVGTLAPSGGAHGQNPPAK